VSIDGLADWMIDLEQQGAHNVNLVSPTPWAVHVAGAIETARKRGLVVPVVYNTGGYDSLEALERLQGLVDVYLPDVKYATDRPARIYSAAEDYVQVNRRAVLEMDRQVGPLRLDERGIAVRGSIVRHLILPRGLADTDLVLAWIVDRLGPDAFVSLMAQYKPWHHVVTEPVRYCELNRPLTEREYETALETAAVLGMENLFVQELTSADVYLPDFDRADVFSRTR
jgi:putative pyruvate formate lyase activating enzyme